MAPFSRDTQRSFLSCPVEGQRAAFEQCLRGQLRRLATFEDGLDDHRSKKSQGEQAPDIAGGDASASGDLSERCSPAASQVVEPSMGPRDDLQQSWVGF
jgi:hypothetical protein